MRTAPATIAALLLALSGAGCGVQQLGQGQNAGGSAGAGVQDAAGLRAHPQAVEPTAGGAAGAGQPAAAAAQAGAPPSSVGTGSADAQPVSDAAIRKELAQSGMSANLTRATLTPDGLAIPPAGAPAAVDAVIEAGNEIAHLPYRFGGGHGTFEDTAYDCSGSLSFVFAASGLLSTTMTSGELMSWGDAGPGKWITVFANAGHTFMYVAGLRFDTVALAETGSRWSNRSADEGGGFAVRHPPGL